MEGMATSDGLINRRSMRVGEDPRLQFWNSDHRSRPDWLRSLRVCSALDLRFSVGPTQVWSFSAPQAEWFWCSSRRPARVLQRPMVPRGEEDAQRRFKRGNDQMIRDDLYNAVPGSDQQRRSLVGDSGQGSGARGCSSSCRFMTMDSYAHDGRTSH